MESNNKTSLIFEELLDIINKHDPMSYLDMGAPPDEYIFEVQLMMPFIEKCKTIEELSQRMLSIFENRCDSVGSNYKKDFDLIAYDIFELIKNKQMR